MKAKRIIKMKFVVKSVEEIANDTAVFTIEISGIVGIIRKIMPVISGLTVNLQDGKLDVMDIVMLIPAIVAVFKK